MLIRMSAALALILPTVACGHDAANAPPCSLGMSCTTTVSEASASTTSDFAETTTSSTSVPRTESVQELTFTIPPDLKYRTDGFASTAEGFSAFYANFSLGPVCVEGCGLRSFSPLPPDGVVVGMGVLSGLGEGGPDPANPAPNITVAGRDAVWTSDKPGSCGGDETIAIRIPHPDGNEYIVRACVSGPDLIAAENTVQALLASATLSAT